MALFLKQNDERSELQSRVDQELREKLQARQALDMDESESTLTEDQSTSKGFGFIIAIVALIGIAGFIVWLAVS